MRLFSYSHLFEKICPLFLPPVGLGVDDILKDLPSCKLDRLKGDGDPKLDLRPESRPPALTALWIKGLADGDIEKLSSNLLLLCGLPRADRGDVLRPRGLAFRDPDDTRYLGGVIYELSGVAGEAL